QQQDAVGGVQKQIDPVIPLGILRTEQIVRVEGDVSQRAGLPETENLPAEAGAGDVSVDQKGVIVEVKTGVGDVDVGHQYQQDQRRGLPRETIEQRWRLRNFLGC